MKADSLPTDPRTRNVALAAFAMIAVILTGLGFWYYYAEKGEITRKQYQTLAAIGELKAKHIQQWRKERLAEVERAAKDALTRKTISDVLAVPASQNVQKELQECLRDEVTEQDSSSALLFDTRGNLLASTDHAGGPVNTATQKAMREAITGNKSVVSDFYRNPDGVIHIDLAAPVPDDHGQPEAVLILRHEAGSYLYPLLQEWPTPSRSAETLLVQRDGDEVAFLSNLRHRSDTALSRRHPLTDTQLPAVQAALGKQGIFEGKDYRGVDVVCALLPVAGSPWFITAEVDAEEILADARYRAGVITLIGGLLILLAAGVVAYSYRQRQAGILNGLIKAERQKSEAQERELKIGQQHRTILQTAMDGFCIVDAQGRIREVNDAYCRMTGYSEQELVSMRIADLEASESLEDTAVRIKKILAQGQDFFETRQRRKDGSLIDVEVSVQSKPAEGAVVSFLRDITGRKQAEVCRKIGGEILQGLLQSDDLQSSVRHIVASLKNGIGFDAVGIRLEDGEDFPYAFQEGFSEGFLRTENSLAARAPGGGVCRDKDGKVRLECTCGLVISGKTDPANPLFTRGGSCWTNDSLALPGILAGKDPRLHPRDQCIHHGYASVALIPIRTQERIIGLIQLNDRSKGCFTLETVEILEGIAGYIGEALMRKKSELERNEALLRAEASAAAKSEFLGVMSHELRTPLNGVLGFSELLSETALNDEQKSYAQTIRKSGEHLLAIVNDVLDFSSIEKGNLSIQVAPLAVADLVKDSAQAAQKAAADKGLDFRCDVAAGVPEQIVGDEQRIRQILINLLGNAVKFTASGSVVLRVAPASVEGMRFLDFSIADTGIGISAGKIAPLFEPFAQLDATTRRRFGGTGLGLAISQRLAEAMGGKILAVSAERTGSTFTFQLPLEIPGAGGMASVPSHLSDRGGNNSALTEQRPPAQTGGTRAESGPVLVVDDDRASGVVAVKMLQNLGYHAEFVPNGAEAVASFVPGKYSVILMDIAMPVMDGLVATRKIREIENATGFPVRIIAFTANVMPGDRERCLAAGMDDFLAKPVKKDTLAHTLASVQSRS